jgi:hypothetical protein
MAFYSVKIDADEYVSSCSKDEIKELIYTLIDEGYLPEGTYPTDPDETSVNDLEWVNACLKLSRGKHLLSNQDEQTIFSISKKII